MMNWLNKIWTDLEQLFTKGTEHIQTNPQSGYLIATALLLIWLIGLIAGWKWTYARPGSWGGNFWLDLLGPATFRFWLGVIVLLAIILCLYLYFKT